MINYKRTNWYGFGYLLRLRGSLLPHCVPAMIFAGALAGVLTMDVVTQWLDRTDWTGPSLFVDKYSMQLFGVVFGYIAVARLNVSYQRYWEGISSIKAMQSKWLDACSQTIAFDRVDDAGDDFSSDAFSVHIVRLFIQLSAVSTLMLHLEAEEIDKLWASMEKEITGGLSARTSVRIGDDQMRTTVLQRNLKNFVDRPRHEDWLRRCISRVDRSGRDKQSPAATRAERAQAANLERQKTGFRFNTPRVSHVYASDLGLIEYAASALDLANIFTHREVKYLRGLPDPVVAMGYRIYRAVTTRGRARGWKTPPPIVSRVFQELSNGNLAFNHATKMKEVPVPFAYVQFNALLLNSFNLLCPMAVARFTENTLMSVLTAALITGGFTALWLVANELEDPFGTDQNDLPVLQYHESFCGSCRSLLHFLEEDTWVADSGPWKPPKEAALSARAEKHADNGGGVKGTPPSQRQLKSGRKPLSSRLAQAALDQRMTGQPATPPKISERSTPKSSGGWFGA